MKRTGMRVVLLAAGAVLLLGAPAWAHAKLVGSSPADGQRLSEPPREVRATFSEELDAKESALRVLDATGKEVAHGGVDLNDPDHRRMAAGLPPSLAPGRYAVRWHAVTPDDHAVEEGVFSFELATSVPPTGQAAAAPATTASGGVRAGTETVAPQASHQSAPSRLVPLLVLAAAVLVVGGGLWLARLARPARPGGKKPV